MEQKQTAFNFMDDESLLSDSPDLYHSEKTSDKLEELLNSGEYNGMLGILSVLQKFNYEHDLIKFQIGKKIIKVKINDDIYIIEDFHDPSLWLATDWLDHVDSHNNIHDYIEEDDYSSNFWEYTNDSSVLYHATKKDRLDDIKKNGLIVRNETRGLSNRSARNGIFTSTVPEGVESYGDVVFVIQIGLMKKAGYTPEVSLEEPWQKLQYMLSLAAKIDDDLYEHLSTRINELGNEGISIDTRVTTVERKSTKIY